MVGPPARRTPALEFRPEPSRFRRPGQERPSIELAGHPLRWAWIRLQKGSDSMGTVNEQIARSAGRNIWHFEGIFHLGAIAADDALPPAFREALDDDAVDIAKAVGIAGADALSMCGDDVIDDLRDHAISGLLVQVATPVREYGDDSALPSSAGDTTTRPGSTARIWRNCCRRSRRGSRKRLPDSGSSRCTGPRSSASTHGRRHPDRNHGNTPGNAQGP